MDPGNQPSSPSVPTPGVWPPRPTVEGDAPEVQPVWYPFTQDYRRVDGNLSDFRNGWVGLSENGVNIAGKAALRAELKTPLLILSLFIGIGIVIAYIVLEYACRSNASLQLGWDQIKQIVISQKARRVCLVFSASNYAGVVKTFSLAFRLNPDAFASFVENSNKFAPDRTAEGRIPGATPLALWIFLVLVLALFVGGLIYLVALPPASR